MAPSSEYRRRAREALDGSIFSAAWLLLLVAGLVVNAILGASSIIFVGPLLLTGPLYAGFAVYTLHLIRRTPRRNDLGTLFSGFSTDFTGNLVLGLLQSVYLVLWSLLFVIPGIVKYYAYSMSYYIKADNPTLDANACIDQIQKMMKGHKAELFLLDLSFLGWIIVGALCFGVGTLWVDAYITAAHASFYEDLRAQPQIV